MADVAAFLEFVTGEIGRPYVYGGETPAGFDCSGLVQWAAGKAGISGVPRTSEAQFAALPATSSPGPGDLVFFRSPAGGPPPGHVGVCADTGCVHMIDAPHSGAFVRVEPVAGFGDVMGYRSLGAAPGATPALDASLIPNPFSGVDPGSILGGVTDPVGEIGKLLGQVPAAFLKVLLGGHELVEIVLRTVEIVGGAILLAVGGVVMLRVIASGGESGRVASEAARQAAGARRAARGAQSELRAARRRSERAARDRNPARRPAPASSSGARPRQYAGATDRRASASRRALPAPGSSSGARGDVIDVRSRVR